MSTTRRNFQPSMAGEVVVTATRSSNPRILLRIGALGSSPMVLSDYTPREAKLLARMLNEACKDVED